MTLSLCVVARNEAAFLRACLDSARRLVDEMIVVDTGSTDATPEIARRAGARLIRAAWPGDLGAAHNLPLEHARGDWILSLDADEELDPRACDRIPEILRAPRADGYRLAIRNYTHYPPTKRRSVDPSDALTRGGLAFIPTSPVRLFRRRYRFVGQLHQSLTPSIATAGGRIEDSGAVIHHYGFLRFDRAKDSLYRILARRQVQITPRDPRAWIDLGLAYSTLRRERPSALAAFRHAHTLGRRAEASFLIGRALVESDQPRAAVPVLRRAIRLNGDEAAADFDRADAHELLGHALELLRRLHEAEAAYAGALRLRPDSPGALNNLAGLLIERGRLRSAERLVDRLISAFPGLSTAWATLGTLRLQQGDLDAARHAYETALDITPLYRVALENLGLVHERAGRLRLAARVRRAASELRWGEASPGAASPGRPPRAAARRSRQDVVMSLISYLHGGSGRVLVDAVAALPRHRHVVLCLEPGDASGQRLREELRTLGAEIRTIASGEDVARALRELRPRVVLHHWSGGPPLGEPLPSRGERWIAIGHSPLPMPAGYDRYVVLSAFQRQFQRHLPPARVHRLPNGVDLRRFGRPARSSGRPVTIAMLTRLDPGKFPRQLLAFLPDLRTLGARLLVAGRGARRWEIEPELEGLGIPVRFIGPIPSSRVPAFLARADIGLHLTETHEETCSMTILEMLAAGLPIVAEPKGCLPEMVAPHANGFLAAAPGEIAGHLEELVRSRDLRRRFGAESRRRARTYSMDRYRRSMRTLIRTACAARPYARQPRPAFADPATVSLCGWRPSLTYFICAATAGLGSRVAAALHATGVAGIPQACFDPEGGWRGLRGSALAASIAKTIEAGATPNGVFGAVVLPSHLAALRRAVEGPRGFAKLFGDPRYVVIADDHGRSPRDGWPTFRGASVVSVRAADVVRDPGRTARSVLRRLGLRA